MHKTKGIFMHIGPAFLRFSLEEADCIFLSGGRFARKEWNAAHMHKIPKNAGRYFL